MGRPSSEYVSTAGHVYPPHFSPQAGNFSPGQLPVFSVRNSYTPDMKQDPKGFTIGEQKGGATLIPLDRERMTPSTSASIGMSGRLASPRGQDGGTDSPLLASSIYTNQRAGGYVTSMAPHLGQPQQRQTFFSSYSEMMDERDAAMYSTSYAYIPGNPNPVLVTSANDRDREQREGEQRHIVVPAPSRRSGGSSPPLSHTYRQVVHTSVAEAQNLERLRQVEMARLGSPGPVPGPRDQDHLLVLLQV